MYKSLSLIVLQVIVPKFLNGNVLKENIIANRYMTISFQETVKKNIHQRLKKLSSVLSIKFFYETCTTL